ncbi:YidB family protein [Streptomyces sp. SCSIO 30461]|uniref:YidB family protein n=1 Tax=Streptomyces sp. SCSIO 30461 TaxID=3118085 RepID=UPI0030D2FC10
MGALGGTSRTGDGFGKAAAVAENDLERRLGVLLGDELTGDGRGGLLASLFSEVGDSGQGGGNPLQGLVNELNEGGLADKVGSWVGPGGNEPVSGPELAQALPYQVLDRVARQADVAPEQAADLLAEALPQAVDRLTPEGQVPQGLL